MKCLFKIIITLLVLSAGLPASAQVSDDKLASEIKKQINANKALLYYPKSVQRYYKQRNFKSNWLKPQSGTGQTWQAMLTLDCVMAFGLSHDDYHPKLLTYTLAHTLLDTPGKADLKTQAIFEVTLTDALLTLMNHLHYGKLNPVYKAGRIDAGIDLKFKADTYLANLNGEKDIITAIAEVQPKNKWYINLQRRMQLLKGKYLDDCYEVPEAEVRKIAINMERLRWADITGGRFILVNIPSGTVAYKQADTAYRFKLIAGRPLPVLRGAITNFTISNNAVVLGLTNNGGVYLPHKPEQGNIKQISPAGPVKYIRVIKDANLVKLLMESDNTRPLKAAYNNKTYKLKTPVPLYITYLTCAVDEWGMVNYNDVYGQDKALENALYHMAGR